MRSSPVITRRAAMSSERDTLVDLVLNRYFKRLDARDFDAALACFHDDARFTILPAGLVSIGRAAIREQLEGVLARHVSVERHPQHIAVDLSTGCVMVGFSALFTGHDGQRHAMNNVNVWQVREGRFSDVTVYVSDSGFIRD
jgi:ketosteroid isomerase-like protein